MEDTEAIIKAIRSLLEKVRNLELQVNVLKANISSGTPAQYSAFLNPQSLESIKVITVGASTVTGKVIAPTYDIDPLLDDETIQADLVGGISAPGVDDIVTVAYIGDNDDTPKYYVMGGGSTGQTSFVFKIVTNNGDGTYVGQRYDYPRGTIVGSPNIPVAEYQLSPNVPVNFWVEAILRDDGFYYFNDPLGAC